MCSIDWRSNKVQNGWMPRGGELILAVDAERIFVYEGRGIDFDIIDDNAVALFRWKPGEQALFGFRLILGINRVSSFFISFDADVQQVTHVSARFIGVAIGRRDGAQAFGGFGEGIDGIVNLLFGREA
jgi:hypothetical protein